MPQNLYIPVPYYQFVPDAVNYQLSALNYKPMPNKKIHRHCPFIIIDADYINEPLMDVAVATAGEDSEPTPDTVADDSHQTDIDSQQIPSPKPALSSEQQQSQANTEESLEPADPESAQKEKERLDYLARQPADPKNNTGNSIEQMQVTESDDTSQPQSDSSPKSVQITSNEQQVETEVAQSEDVMIQTNSSNLPEINSIDKNNNEEYSGETVEDLDTNLDAENSQKLNDDSLTLNVDSDTESSKINNTNELEDAHYEDAHQDEKDDKDDDDELTEEERQKKEKEEKLESYKQFVAEQKSKVDVDYQGIRVDIEANALPSRMYFIMNALSAIIASYGLVINSAAVVIGAMLVAMMLGPISGVALAIIDYRMPFLRKSLMTVLAGGAMVVIIGFVVGLLHQATPLSSEILSRTQPTSMDLMIALAGGTAGAYAMISPHLSVAVVGVAVATALVPPLAASGILFAHGEGTLGLGALILAVTNIIAIQFTNALVLWFTGFRRLVKDDYKTNTYYAFLRRNAVPLILLAGIGGYLTYNFNTITKRQQFETAVKETISDYFIEQGNALTATQFMSRDDYQTVRAVIRGETRPASSDVKKIESIVNQQIIESYPKYQPVRIQIRYMPVVVIESSPSDLDNLDKTDVAILSNESQ